MAAAMAIMAAFSYLQYGGGSAQLWPVWPNIRRQLNDSAESWRNLFISGL